MGNYYIIIRTEIGQNGDLIQLKNKKAYLSAIDTLNKMFGNCKTINDDNQYFTMTHNIYRKGEMSVSVIATYDKQK